MEKISVKKETETKVPMMLTFKQLVDAVPQTSAYFWRSVVSSGKVLAVRAGKGRILVNFDDAIRFLNSTRLSDLDEDKSHKKSGIREIGAEKYHK